MISSLKIKLYLRILEELGSAFGVSLERSWWLGFNGIYLVRFGLRMQRILIFKWFLPLKIQINSKKPGFARNNQFITWSNLKAYHSIQAWFPFIFYYSKNRYIHCKTMFTCSVSLICNGFTLGSTAHATLVYVRRKVVCLYCFVFVLFGL
jgi:hypothetical protein